MSRNKSAASFADIDPKVINNDRHQMLFLGKLSKKELDNPKYEVMMSRLHDLYSRFLDAVEIIGKTSGIEVRAKTAFKLKVQGGKKNGKL